MLAPEGYGEIIGGSQREDDYDKLLARIRTEQLPEDAYSWYLDLPKYGTFVHAGFGLGGERPVAWIFGIPHIREAIPVPRALYQPLAGTVRGHVAPHLRELADGIQEAISLGGGRKNQADDAPTDHPLFEDPAWEAVPDRHERDRLRAKARSQLGTVGSGNHYVDVFADDADRIWVGVHFGSRGFGFGVAHGFLALGQNRAWGERVPERETLLDVTSPVGDAYWQLMNLAGRYAYAGREWVTRKVVELLGGREQELVHNHHNFAWREEHGGEPFYVVRKGATPAFPGQKGFVGGSMGDDAVIIQGVASDSAEVRDLQARALYSTVHGAGRVMSRTAAAGKRTRRGKVTKPGAISREMMLEWVEQKGVVLRGGGADESPHVYRRLPEVLAAQGPTVEVLHVLHPLVVVMAGVEEFDPYKD